MAPLENCSECVERALLEPAIKKLEETGGAGAVNISKRLSGLDEDGVYGGATPAAASDASLLKFSTGMLA